MGSQAHGTAFAGDILLIIQESDDWIRCLFIKFDGVSFFESQTIPGKFNDSHLHSEAQTQVWEFFLAGISNCLDFSFCASFSESAWHENS